MPNIIINDTNIINFGFTVKFNIKSKKVIFNTSQSSYQGSSGSGVFQISGICFSLIDQHGLELAGVDWNNPQIIPSVNQEYELDLSSLNYAFLFQNYKIVGYIKENNGTEYSTLPVVKTVCQPVGINESGYVPGVFQLLSNCVNNTLTVKDLTVFAYNNQLPETITKDGNLYYPTGTISAVAFSGTPFTNNVVYTGQYSIVCTTEATYNLGDGVYVVVTYYTDSNYGGTFNVTCTTRVADLLCCVTEWEQRAIEQCDNAVGQQARQKLLEISPFLASGLLAEINGQDGSFAANYIKKTLNCNCGATSIHQNEQTPINPSIYNIVIEGINGTSVPSPEQIGNTKKYKVSSNIYQVAKGNPADTAFTITQDTQTTGVVKYLITFNYSVMAGYIINAIENNPTYIAQLQNILVTALDLSGLDGKCILDTATYDYTGQFVSITASDLVESITINGIVHNAPSNTHANDAAATQTWLNSLTLGTFTVTFNSGILTVTSLNNDKVISTMSVAKGGSAETLYTIQFQSSQWTLVQILQFIIDYLCALTAGQIKLGTPLTLYYTDYNGNIVQQNFTSQDTQESYNSALSSFLNSLALSFQNMVVWTCAKLKALLPDRPNDTFTTSDRIFGTLGGGNCAALTDQQFALVVVQAINKYADVKSAFCAIDCGTPASCPEVSGTSLAMVGNDIGFYGLSWANTPNASQTVTVRYKLSSSGTWLVASNGITILPNGNISGTTPFIVLASAVQGQIYDVMVVNNCGGVGFSKQIQVPSSSVYTANYLLENSLYLICGKTPVTLYSNLPFASGVTLYSNIGLTIPVTGYNYITVAGFNIYVLNPATGVVGVDTGSACTSGTNGKYRLNNTLLSICGVADGDYYTNGAFAIGKILYHDVALTTPVTGFAYVEPTDTEIIYNISSITGQIGASTGLNCSV